MSIVSATRYVASVELIDIDELAADGIRVLLLDRDNTCVPRDRKSAPAAVVEWVARAREAGMGVCLISNNFHADQIARTAEELGAEELHFACKPLPFSIDRALKRMGAAREEAVLIGDQVWTDIVAGNLAGVRTILVRPQSRSDLWYTHILRVFERFVLRKVRFEGE